MLIKAHTPEGDEAQIYNEDGTIVELPIFEYDTETQVAKHYILDEEGHMKTTEWVHDENGKGSRQFLTAETHLPGSYAMIDGKKV